MNSADFYQEWATAFAQRAHMELARPYNVATGFADCVNSGDCFYYPWKGIQLFFSDWQNTLPIYFSLTLPVLALQLVLRTFFFVFLVPINAVLLTLTTGPAGPYLAIVLSFCEAVQLSEQAMKAVLPAEAVTNAKHTALFDHILCLTGNEKTVFPGKLQRVVEPSPTAEVFNLDNHLAFTYTAVKWTAIKLIPIVGGPYLAYKDLVGDLTHRKARLYRLQRLRKRQVGYYHVKHREGRVVAFGLVAYLLEAIPVVGPLFFRFTNQIGLAFLCGEEMRKSTTDIADGASGNAGSATGRPDL